MTTPQLESCRSLEGFRHEALLYAGDQEFLAGTAAFIRDGLSADEAILVVVSAAKIAALRDELGPDADGVQFADMHDVGLNPARIIPAWQAFVDDEPGTVRGRRGIGEPIWDGRNPAELVECQRHESLLNVAFEGGLGWSLLCPYDTETLDSAVIDEARASHPYVRADGRSQPSRGYRGTDASGAPFDQPLPEPSVAPLEFAFGAETLKAARDVVAGFATRAGLGAMLASDLVTVANELATNCLLHATGHGLLRLWQEGDRLVCEVRDDGHFDDRPLVGRERPTLEQVSGRGLWVANQLCELVQIRSYPTGTVVRVHLSRS
jgi:anti-sigma regulatory factor (Ser/Thr protein kinase)